MTEHSRIRPLLLLLLGLSLAAPALVLAVAKISNLTRQEPRYFVIESKREATQEERENAVKWGIVGAVGVGNIPGDRQLTVEEAKRLKSPRVQFPDFLPPDARLIMLYKWGPTVFIGLTPDGGLSTRAAYPYLMPGGYPLVIQVYELKGKLLVVAASPEAQAPAYESPSWQHPIEQGRQNIVEGSGRGWTRGGQEAKYVKRNITIDGLLGVAVNGTTAVSGPVNFIDWWKEGTRNLVSGPEFKADELLRIAKSLTKEPRWLLIGPPSVDLRTEDDDDKLYGYSKGLSVSKNLIPLEEALKLKSPVVLRPKYLPEGAKFLYAYKWPEWENRVVLRYDINGYFLDIMAEDNKKYYSRDYDDIAPIMQVTLKGGAPVLPEGSYKALDVGNFRGMGAEPTTAPTEEDHRVTPIDQMSMGIVFWDKGGDTDYSIRGIGFSVDELVRIAKAM